MATTVVKKLKPAVTRTVTTTKKAAKPTRTVKTVYVEEDESPILTLDQALNSESSQLYVLNTSNQVNKGKKYSEVLIDVVMPNGSSNLLTIPESWLPYDVSASMPVEDALSSTNFRRAINEGLVALISNKEAQRILKANAEDVRSERRRLANRGKDDEDVVAEDESDSEDLESGVMPQVISLLSRTMSPRDRLAAFKAIGAEAITDKDIKYIISRVYSTESKLLAWVDGIRESRRR